MTIQHHKSIVKEGDLIDLNITAEFLDMIC